MNTRKLLFTALLIATLAPGVGMALAQDDGGGADADRTSEKRWSGFARRGGFGHHGFGGRGMMLPGGAELMALVSDATGLAAPELVSALRGGDTLAGLIEAEGGDVEAFIAEAIALATENANARIAERIEAMVRGEHPAGMKDMGRRGFGRGGPRGFAGRGAPWSMAGMAGILDASVLEATGLEAADLYDALREGNSLAGLIEAEGGDVEAFIAGISESFSARADAAVAAGRLSEERAGAYREAMAERLEALVHGDFTAMKDGRAWRGWPHGDKDSDMEADEHEETQTTDT